MSGGKTWTDGEESELRSLWGDGLLVREICQRMGRSCGAVVAKIDRLGLPPRSKESLSQVMRKERRAAPSPVSPVAPRQARETGLVSPCRTPFTELQPGQCKWPHGDREIMFCARQIEGRGPYCADHMRKAFSPRVVVMKK